MGRTLLSDAFDFDLDFDSAPPRDARSTVEERRFQRRVKRKEKEPGFSR